ncbi:MAG: chemotaxis protein CheW [Actinomycetota bacterium]
MDEIIEEFLVESHENLDRLDVDLVRLEDDPDDVDVLAGIFRDVHTIKGTSGFLGYGKLESVAHVGESLLARLRDRELQLDAARTSVLLAMVDALREILASIAADGTEGTGEYGPLVARLDAAAQDAPDLVDPAVADAPVAEARGTETTPVDEPRDVAGTTSDATIRVDVDLLDNLMNLVGELVLARNQLVQVAARSGSSTLADTSQRLNLITTELQEGVMKTRMQPIGNVFGRFPRVVRDIAVSLGKQVTVELEGKDTELDKTIIEAIKDPLTHMVRNSVDHGIETPEMRRAAGKPETGRVTLRAYHEGGQVNIEIADDGAGIDPGAVAVNAVAKGIVTAEQAQAMTDRQIVDLVFAPGFSTVESVSNLSGRGVGMDVVRTAIERIGGSVDLTSTPGAGTITKLKIPLTLAIIPALIVTSGGQRFAIPQVSLLELVRVEADEATTAIEHVHGTPVYRLRDALLPLVGLADVLGLDTTPTAASNIVVLQADTQQFGLVVDAVDDTAEIVVKPLGQALHDLSVYAGATIMGDGRVALILDVMGIADSVGIGSTSNRAQPSGDDATLGGFDVESLPVVCIGTGQHGKDVRMVLPLRQVARLEEIDGSLVEYASGQPVVQYRNAILPLVDLSRVLGLGQPDHASPTLQVIVHERGAHRVGLVVHRIHDVLDEPLVLQGSSPRHGVLGSAVVGDRVTDVLDVQAVIATVAPEMLDHELVTA